MLIFRTTGEAINKEGMVAIGQVVFTSHEHIIALEARGKGMNRTGFAGGRLVNQRHGWLFQYGVVALLGFGRRDVADGLQEPPVVERIHPFEGGELDRLEQIAHGPRR